MYVKIIDENTKIYPYTEKMLRQDNLNVSFPKVLPDDLSEYGVYAVTVNNVVPDKYQTVQEGVVELTEEVYTISNTLVDKDLGICKTIAVKEIDNATATAIRELATFEKQNNYQAKYTELLEKKFDGIVLSAEETTTMTNLKALWLQIETLVNNGNTKEQQVQNSTSIDAIRSIMKGQ